jgi:hypothetical protein
MWFPRSVTLVPAKACHKLSKTVPRTTLKRSLPNYTNELCGRPNSRSPRRLA